MLVTAEKSFSPEITLTTSFNPVPLNVGLVGGRLTHGLIHASYDVAESAACREKAAVKKIIVSDTVRIRFATLKLTQSPDSPEHLFMLAHSSRCR
jgi:hypothetical protein